MKISKEQNRSYVPITITLETPQDYYDLYHMIDLYTEQRHQISLDEYERAILLMKDLKKANDR